MVVDQPASIGALPIAVARDMGCEVVRIQHAAVLRLLDPFGSPAQIREAGRRRLVSLIRPRAPRMAERLVEDIFRALDERTVVVPGTDAAALIVPSLANPLQVVLDQRRLLAARRPSRRGPRSTANTRNGTATVS